MEILLQDLVPLLITLDDPDLTLAILGTDQLIVDHTYPALLRRQCNDHAAAEMRLR